MAESQLAELDPEAARDVIETIIGALDREAEDRVGKRQVVEDRWLADLRQYHGQYDQAISADLTKNAKSSLFINKTRPKTNTMESRLSDMLFPTDDRNWGIGPTSVPELTVESERAAKAAADAALQAAVLPNAGELQHASAVAEQRQLMIESRMDEARERARAMEEEIDDHLRECQYSIQAREVIRDACKIGTGVMKGPVTDGKFKRNWTLNDVESDEEGEDPKQEYRLTHGSDERPAYWRVDPWNFFPDSDAANMHENERVFERHLFNKKQMRRLARQKGFYKDAFRTLLALDPTQSVPTYLSDLRSITSSYNDFQKDRYHVWEYHGPLTAEDMIDLSDALGDPDKSKDIDEEADPLEEIQVVIWFCQGEVMKFGIHHLDSGDSLYSVFNLEADEASVFGFGIPHIMKDAQTALAGAWRALMDNMGLSAGPQIVINEEIIEPENGVWLIEPRKIWIKLKNAAAGEKPFEAFDIPSNMEELLAVIEVSNQNIDDETNLPMLAQGEQGAQVTKTAQGMSLLMNSVNVIFRRIVKNWDDNMTTPNITRMYDWLMQFSDKEEIKGDYQVDARGTSVLLVREMQSANMMTFLQMFADHPVLSKYLKEEGLPALRRLAKSMMVPANEVVKTDAEIKEDEAKAAKEPLPPDPEILKIEMAYNLEAMRGENSMRELDMKRETSLVELAQKSNLTLEQLREQSNTAMLKLQIDREKAQADMQNKAKDRESKERIVQTEVAVALKTGEHAGGSI